MVLCQVYLSTAANLLYAIGVPPGRKRAELVGIYYTQTDTVARNIVIVSNTIKVRYGNNSNFIFSSVVSTQVKQMFNVVFDMTVNGNLDIQLVDLTTGVAPVNFSSCILYFDISDFEN